MSTSKPKTITIADRATYQRALQNRAVPDIYAFMAAQELSSRWGAEELTDAGAYSLIYGGFIWGDSPQGHEFWSAVAEDALL